MMYRLANNIDVAISCRISYENDLVVWLKAL